ncbi:MAG: hypothetical protein AAF587_42870 [Bacteroidota bacterium]
MKYLGLFVGIFSMLMFVYSCGGGHSHEEDQAHADHHGEEGDHDITLTALEGSPQFHGASLSLNSFSAGENGAYNFDFKVEGYELGAQTDAQLGLANSGKGQHIHFIVDNGPYSAHYDPTFSSDKLAEAGNHVVLAFLSRSYHESVKNMGEASSFVVTQMGEGEQADLSTQHMFYSRPKGTYKGDDTKKLLLDFFLLNTDLSEDGNNVRAVINGQEFMLTEWKPYVIEGLPMGEVTIKLELIDGAGNLIPGPFNSVSRTVTLAPADS